MITNIFNGVCALIIACNHASMAWRIVFGILSFISFVIAMGCHRTVVKRIEVLEELMKTQLNVNKHIANALSKIIGLKEDDLK